MGALAGGDHVGLLFAADGDRDDHVGRYVAEGLRDGDRVVVLGGETLAADTLAAVRTAGVAPEPYVASGQLVVSATSGRFPPGDVDAAAMAAWVRGEMRLAEGTGDPRVRVVTEMPEPLRGAAAAEQALAYERAIDAVVRETGAIALCRYDARLFGADAMAAAARAHRRVVSQRSQEVLGTPVMALLVVTRGEEGTFSVDGEVDASNIAEFEAALTTAVAGLSELVADLARVRFMDLTAVRALERQAERLGEAGGRLVLQSPPRFVERIMEILGVEGRVPLVVRHPPAGDRPSLNPPAP